MEKAYLASQSGAVVVCLVNASTCSGWWHSYAVKGEIYYIRGRLRFVKNGKQQPAYNRDSVIVVFSPPSKKQVSKSNSNNNIKPENKLYLKRGKLNTITRTN